MQLVKDLKFVENRGQEIQRLMDLMSFAPKLAMIYYKTTESGLRASKVMTDFKNEIMMKNMKKNEIKNSYRSKCRKSFLNNENQNK